jgi:hypothetical protein
LGQKSEECKCKRQCSKKFPEGVMKITDEFKGLKENNMQDAYLFGLISMHPIARYIYMHSFVFLFIWH